MSDGKHAYNILSGFAKSVLQAGTIKGDINIRQGVESAHFSEPRQLPPDVRGFIGREAYLAELNSFLSDQESFGGHLLVCTIVGIAGVGKTTLAVHWAHQVQEHFRDGQIYIDLRGFAAVAPLNPGEALGRALRSLGMPPRSIPESTDERTALFRSITADKRFLIVLDNAIDSAQARALLPNASNCLVLVTSRNWLSGLVANEGAHAIKVGLLDECESIDLLREMIGVERSEGNLDALKRMSRSCVGLPLALRLAGERTTEDRYAKLDVLASELERQRTALDEAVSENGAGEIGTVRGVLSWSYNALSSDSKKLFRYLGLHPGAHFTPPVAAALLGVSHETASRLLNGLARASIVEKTVAQTYLMHDLLREYSIELVLVIECEQAREIAFRRLIDWYLQTAEAARECIVPHYRKIPSGEINEAVVPLEFVGYNDAFTWCLAEQSNLAAVIRAAHERGYDDFCWRIPAVMQRFYYVHKPWEDWLSVSRIGLASARQGGDAFGEAELLNSLGIAYTGLRRLGDALSCHRDALLKRRQIGDRYGEGVSLNNIGYVHMLQREMDEAKSLFLRSLSIAREVGSPIREGMALLNLGSLSFQVGNPAEAIFQLSKALKIFCALKDVAFEAEALRRLGRSYQSVGRIIEAMESHSQAVAIYSSLNDRGRQALSLVRLGDVERKNDRANAALISYDAALEIYRSYRDPHQMALAYEGAGLAYFQLGRVEDSVECYQAALRIRHEVDDRWAAASVLENLSQVLVVLGKTERAEAALLEASNLLLHLPDPDSSSVRDRIRLLRARVAEVTDRPAN